jgi:hypothetical protein
LQAGPGQFCNSCGKPLDAPDLELLSGETVSNEGADVVFSSGTNRGRSAIAIVGVLAVLGGVAAFSGKGASKAAPTTLPSTTTSSVPTTSSLDTTTTSPGFVELAVPGPRQLTTPIIAEKTGLKLLLVGLQFPMAAPDNSNGAIEAGMTIAYMNTNAIVDLDSGNINPVASVFSNFSGPDVASIVPIGTGLLVTDTAGIASVVEPDGTTRHFDTRIPNEPAKVGRDLVWSQDYGTGSGKLVAHDRRDGHEVAAIAMPQSAGLIGVDSDDHAIVSEIGTGTYSFDPTTKLFTRLTRNLTLAVQGDQRIERSCDDHLVCNTIMVKGDEVTVLPDLNPFGGLTLSPDGRYALQTVQSNTSNSGQIVQLVDLTTGARRPLENSSNQIGSFVWSSDSQWLFGIVDGELVVLKEGTAETRHLAFDGEPVRASSVGVFPTG